MEWSSILRYNIGGMGEICRVSWISEIIYKTLYRKLIALRTSNHRLFIDGAITWLTVDDERRLPAYEYSLGEQCALVVFNASDETHQMDLPEGVYRQVYPSDSTVTKTTLRLSSLSARIFLSV